MRWTIRYSKTAEKQLKRLDAGVRNRIVSYMRNRVLALEDPRDLGHGLTGEFESQWTYRIGDYRAVCYLHFDEVLVEVLKVGNRREVYR